VFKLIQCRLHKTKKHTRHGHGCESDSDSESLTEATVTEAAAVVSHVTTSRAGRVRLGVPGEIDGGSTAPARAVSLARRRFLFTYPCVAVQTGRIIVPLFKGAWSA